MANTIRLTKNRTLVHIIHVLNEYTQELIENADQWTDQVLSKKHQFETSHKVFLLAKEKATGGSTLFTWSYN